MTKLELGNFRESEGSNYRGYGLIIDGHKVPEQIKYSIIRFNEDYPYYHLYTNDKNLASTISNIEISDIIPLFECVEFYELKELGLYMNASNALEKEEGTEPQNRISVSILSHKWKKSWSIEELTNEIGGLIPQGLKFRAYKEVDSSPEESNVIDFIFAIGDLTSSMQKEFEKNFPQVALIVETAEKNLKSKSNEKSLLTHFNFPEEIRTSCEQYLLYFVQFLKDAGVQASAKIEHEAGQTGAVLFSVTPEGGKDALDKVRQALEVYLELAQRPNMNPDFSASFEVQKLQFQISNFQGQLHLARAEIQANQAAIALKDTLNSPITKRNNLPRSPNR